MIDTSNPAGRLYALLNVAVGFKDQELTGNVWKRVFELDDTTNDVDIIERIVALYKLSRECRTLIKNHPDLNEDLYLSPFDSIEKAVLQPALHASWQGSKNALSGEVMTSLRFCADALSKHYSEETLSEEDLETIIDNMEMLFVLIEKSSLSDEVRNLLLTELARIQNAIQHYRIKGAKGLKEALQGVIGAMYVNQEVVKKEANDNPEVFNQVGKVLDTVNKFTATALRMQQVGQDVIKLLAPFGV